MSNKLLKSTYTVGVMTLVSRIFGFARDMLAAQMFGAGSGYDAFLVAFKIPNFTRRLFAEGAFSQAFVPVLAQAHATASKEEVKQLISHASGCLLSVLLVVTAIGIIFAPGLVMVFAPGFGDEPERFGLAVYMLRITFSYGLLIALVSLAGSILNVYGKFAVPAITPVLLNLAMIFTMLTLGPKLTPAIISLAWGVILGGVLQLLYQLPSLWKLGLLVRPTWGWRDSMVRKIVKLMVPAIFGSSIVQINLMIDSIFASFLTVGSVSWLYYADRMLEFPLGVFGIALATVVLPHLATTHAKQDRVAFSSAVDWALRLVLIIAIPATIGLFMLAQEMLIVLFNYGKFTATDVNHSGVALQAYALGLSFFILIKILSSAFYAKQEITFPVRMAVVAMFGNLLFNSVFINFLGIAGVALSSTCSAIINSGGLFYLLKKRGYYTPLEGWQKFILRIVSANLVLLWMLWWFTPSIEWWLAARAVTRAIALFSLVCGAVIVYGLSLLLLGLRARDLRLS